jgi:pimeloyl-ACP methyl ester carboxylesterase
VAFLNGLAMPFELWWSTVDRLPPSLSVVLFDRPHRRTHPGGDLQAYAVEIDESLGSVPDPLIMVGHSYGGLLAEAYARLRPDRVAGLVLVDASLPEDYATPPPAESPQEIAKEDVGIAPARITNSDLPLWRKVISGLPEMRYARPTVGKAIAAGVVAGATTHNSFAGVYSDLSAEVAGQLSSKATVSRAMLDDHAIGKVSTSLLQLRAEAKLQIPVAVLVGVSGPRLYPVRQPAWVQRHRRAAPDIGDDVVVHAFDAAHLLMLDQPDATAEAIGKVIARAGLEGAFTADRRECRSPGFHDPQG